MSVAVQAPSEARPLPRPLYRFTVKQYQRMIETGVLTENDRVELLEGWIVAKMPHNPPHDGTINRINRRLTHLLPHPWLLRVQSAIVLSRSEPEPDLTIVRGPEEVYFKRHPRPRDIAVLMEVADSTLLYDRDYKGRIYAQARVVEYWIVNLIESRIEVYNLPKRDDPPGIASGGITIHGMPCRWFSTARKSCASRCASCCPRSRRHSFHVGRCPGKI